MRFQRPKPQTTFLQDVIAAIGRAVLLAFSLAALGVPLLLLGYCQLVVPARMEQQKEAEAARLAACTRLTMLPVRLGDHTLTVPANGLATVRLAQPQPGQYLPNEIGRQTQFNPPPFFCIPPEYGQPPYDVRVVQFVAALDTRSKPILRRIHGLDDQDGIAILRLEPIRDTWNSLPGSAKLPQASAATGDKMDIARPASNDPSLAIARTNKADAQGFLYAATCQRFATTSFFSCDLAIRDTTANLVYRTAYIDLSEDPAGWAQPQPVPPQFIEIGLMMRRVLAEMKAGTLLP